MYKIGGNYQKGTSEYAGETADQVLDISKSNQFLDQKTHNTSY